MMWFENYVYNEIIISLLLQEDCFMIIMFPRQKQSQETQEQCPNLFFFDDFIL